MSTHCVPGSIPSAGPTREDKVDVAQSVMSLPSFPGPRPLPPLMFSLQTAWVKIWVPHFQLCDLEQVTLLLWASIASSVKWRQASTYFIGILQEINEFTYVKYLSQCLAQRAQYVYVCVCVHACVSAFLTLSVCSGCPLSGMLPPFSVETWGFRLGRVSTREDH